MRSVIALGAIGVCAALLSPACGSDDGSKKAPNPYDAGGDGGSSVAGESASGGSAVDAGGEPGSAASAGAGGAAGSDGVEPGGAGAGGSPEGSAGEPASGSGGDGGSGGEGVTGNVVYASFGTKLVWIEPATGKLHEVGDMRSAQGDVTYSEVLLAYGKVPGEAWIVTPRYDATANRPAPELGKIDLCTGVVSDLVTITRAGTAPTAIESLALHPNGTWYVSTGAFAAGAQQYVTNKMGTIDVTTRVVTDLSGTVNTLQDDVDSSTFVGNALYAIDVATNLSQLELFTIDLATGTASSIAKPGFGSTTAVPLRFAYDESRSKAYGWRPSDRNLVELSLLDGTATAIGETHASTVYPNEPSQGFTVAPVCP
jgi:hypothetical protein